MPRLSKIKDSLGRLVGGKKDPGNTPATVAQTATMGAPPTITIHQNTQLPITTTTMTPDQLKARRMARIENAKGLTDALHTKVMLKYLDFVCLTIPFAIIALTTSELGQLFTGKAFNIADQTSVNMYAAALVAELVYAACTFIWQYAEGYAASIDDGVEQARLKRFTTGIGVLWIFFSIISAMGQFYYLKKFWNPTNLDFFTYALITGRVAIYIGSDFACAKYLGWRVTTIKKLVLEEKTKGEAYQLVATQEATRRQLEASSDQVISEIDSAVENQKRSSKVSTEVQDVMSRSAIIFLDRFTKTIDKAMNMAISEVDKNLELPPADYREIDGPKDRGDM